jgi:hypothetical protein
VCPHASVVDHRARGVLVKASELVKRMEKETSYVLFAKPVTAGGSYGIRKNLWTTLFTGDLLSYSGGAVICYTLFDHTSKAIDADTLQYMTGFSKLKKLRAYPKGHNY